MLQKDESQLRAERLFVRLAELRAKLLGEHVDCDSPESMAQIDRIARFLRGRSKMENAQTRNRRGDLRRVAQIPLKRRAVAEVALPSGEDASYALRDCA